MSCLSLYNFFKKCYYKCKRSNKIIPEVSDIKLQHKSNPTCVSYDFENNQEMRRCLYDLGEEQTSKDVVKNSEQLASVTVRMFKNDS